MRMSDPPMSSALQIIIIDERMNRIRKRKHPRAAINGTMIKRKTISAMALVPYKK
jgi:hypothetical protein